MKSLEGENTALPDQDSLGIVFITLGIEGSLLDESVVKLKQELDQELEYAYEEGFDNCSIRRIKKVYFSKIDALLDASSTGPQWLKKYDLVKMVIAQLTELENQQLQTVCYTIMPNHLHLVLEPNNIYGNDLVSKFEQFRENSAQLANDLLKHDQNFWNKDYHLHYIHDQKELINIISYILENPVKAGLVDYWQDWPWTYCNPDYI